MLINDQIPNDAIIARSMEMSNLSHITLAIIAYDIVWNNDRTQKTFIAHLTRFL